MARSPRTTTTLAQLTFGALALALAAAGCAAETKAPGLGDGPGNRIVSDIIACTSDSDCEAGEGCGDGFCQMKRCSEKQYDSLPPLGKVGFAHLDRAFITSRDTATLDVYSAYEKGGSTLTAGAAPLDIAGGNLTGARPEGVAYITRGSKSVVVLADGKTTQLDAGFAGAHIATGDTDGDGIDEIVVLAGGQYAVCNAVAKKCNSATVSGVADDVALGDLNGDGADEILFVGNNTLTIVDLVNKSTSTQPVPPTLAAITAGDLDGDGKVEVIGIEQGHIAKSDRLHVFGMFGDGLGQRAQLSLDYFDSATDLVFTRQDDEPVLAVLGSGTSMKTYRMEGESLVEAGTTTLKARATHIAAADVNGRSATVRLKGEPTVIAGPPVPLAVLTLPPYSALHSAGPSVITMGESATDENGQGSGSSKSSTVSLSVGGGIRGFNLNYHMGQSWTRTMARSKSKSASFTVGGAYTVVANTQVEGFHHGGVVLAGGCFHKYDYTLDDPKKLTKNEGDTFSTWVPIGGETTLWSTNRYNALVDAIADGRMPKIEIAPKLGSVESYPSEPTTLDGKPIPAEDNVFKKSPVKRASDVGAIAFSLTAGEAETNVTATSYNMGRSHSAGTGFEIPIIPVNVDGSMTSEESAGLDSSYAVTVAKSTTFSGNVQPVRDDPSTPANEATLYGYSFRPYVYRHRYKMKDGREGAFFAVTYTAGE